MDFGKRSLSGFSSESLFSIIQLLLLDPKKFGILDIQPLCNECKRDITKTYQVSSFCKLPFPLLLELSFLCTVFWHIYEMLIQLSIIHKFVPLNCTSLMIMGDSLNDGSKVISFKLLISSSCIRMSKFELLPYSNSLSCKIEDFLISNQRTRYTFLTGCVHYGTRINNTDIVPSPTTLVYCNLFSVLYKWTIYNFNNHIS